MQKIRTHYDNLKVARNAPIEVIRASYKTLSQKHHPDRNEGSSESQRVMTIINVSYAALSDPEQRKIHDAWIQQQESFNSYDEQPTKNSDSIDFSLPTSGEINFYDLEENVKTKIKDRASGVNRNQYSIKLDGVAWNYLWTIILFGWFYYIYTSSFEYRWSTETTYWHIGLTVTVGFLLAMNISWIYSWHSHPLKSWLIITPLYLMKLHLDKIIYWPIWTVSDIKATHNYKNGSYQNTSLSITLDGKNELFSIPSEEAYQEFLHRLNEYDQKFRMAANENNIDYFIDNDEFFNIARKNNKSEKKSNSLKIIYAFLAAFSFVFLALSYTYNQERPIKPIHSNNVTTQSIDIVLRTS